jgi:phosphopantothenoylcysteine decarboxylase/phosphopantothenate--cysteine ligase
MVEPEEIRGYVYSLLTAERPLEGKTVIVSAGGTAEPLDPVRFIGNRSSGAMGVAIATEARNRGASVVFVHGHIDVAPPAGVELVEANTASQMKHELVTRQPDADIVIMTAAVADWTPETVSDDKLVKHPGSDTLTLTLTKTADIAAQLGQQKPASQTLVTFSAETESDDDALVARAREKGLEKNADLVVANRVGWQVGFGETETAVWFIQRSGAPVLSTGSKMTVAGRLFDVLQH